MTISEYKDRLNDYIKSLETKNRPFEIAVQTITVEIAKRIFSDGLKSDGSNIGQYDTKKSFYINPKKSPRAGAERVKGIEGLNPPTGKTGKTVFADGSKHKTTYVNNYKEFRNRIGRRIDKVDLKLSGDLFFDWTNSKSLSPRNAKAIKINANEFVISLNRDVNQKKMENFNHKYGKITSPTTKERKRFNDIANAELINDLKKLGLT